MSIRDNSNGHASASERFARFRNRIPERVLVFDGAMGTSLLAQDLPDSAYGGCSRLNESLNLFFPDAVRKVHEGFLAVGCDVVETNTFQGTSIKLAEYGLSEKTDEINRAAAKIARECALKYSTADRPRFTAGSIGPTGALPSLGDPVLDTVALKDLRLAFYEQAKALVLGEGTDAAPAGVDCLIVETGQDLLEQRQAVFAIEELRRDLSAGYSADCECHVRFVGTNASRERRSGVACMFSGFTDRRYRNQLRHRSGGNARERKVWRKRSVWVSVMPNAGLPFEENGIVEWPLTPESMASAQAEFVGRFKVSIVGGCCGTTPSHLRAVVKAIGSWKPSPRRNANPSLFHRRLPR